ncbi:Spy0128 family protein [Butyrivibrio sp. JL13D10]|uniref:Spy0128 family protein n=1 Tax=Butyrivibrio sp. JL13D10 TaxID=3236815 RepID=UPI0038B5A8D2
MRNLDNNRVEGYVKKHNYLKRWISIMLVVALLVTTVTMYSLNKSANALSGDNADDVGMMLEGENVEEFASGNTETGDSDSVQNSESADNSSEENVEENGSLESVEASEDNSSDVADASSSSEESSENADANTESSESEENGTDNSSEETSTDTAADSEAADSSEVVDNGDGTEDAADQNSESDENKDTVASDNALKDSSEIELTENVVLKVSYITEEGEAIADEKEINLSDSLDFTTEAPKQEGYEFKKAEVDGTEIKKITAKQDANGYKYYVVTVGKSIADETEEVASESTDDADAEITIKENKTVILTYKLVETNKTEYVYEDEKVRVIATLEYADAIPDDAEFIVKEVNTETEGYNYDAYMEALNDGEEQSVKNHNAMNTLLYDVGFFVNKTDEEGNVIEGEKTEFQPKEGSVNIKFEFLDGQLSDILEDADSATDLEIDHLPLNEEVKEKVNSTAEATSISSADIDIEKVDNISGSSGDNVEISLNNFSVIGFSAVRKEGNTYKFTKGERTLTYTENSTKDAFRTSGLYDDSLVLGVAGNFHIVSFGTAKLSTHTNGNVLANTLYAGSNFGTNNIDNEVSYAQKITAVSERMASNENHTLVVGDGVSVGFWGNEGFFSINNNKISAPYNIIQDTSTANTPYIDMALVKSEVQAISAKMAATESGDAEVVKGSAGEQIIKYTGVGGAGYLNYTGSQWNSLVSGRELKFEFPNDFEQQSIIINIDCSDVTHILYPTKASVIKVNGTILSTSEEKAVKAGRVVYNFTNVDGKDINMQEVFGQIIAPGANLTITNGNGNFIAENVTILGETHRRDFIGTTEKGAIVSIEAKKLVNGNEPGADQVYTFKAQKMLRPSMNSKELQFTDKVITGQNVGSKISIDVSSFIENKNGLYYVLISEEKGNDSKVGYDTNRYLAEISINSRRDGTKTIYYAESIQYYADNWRRIKADDVVFNNTIDDIPVNISALKYVDDRLAGNNTTGKFSFTLKMLDNDHRSWKKNADGKVKKAVITNNAYQISYKISPSEWGMVYGGNSYKANDKNYQNDHTYYFMLTENDVDGYAKDSTGILIKIKYYSGGEIKYYRASSDEVKSMESNPGVGFYGDANAISPNRCSADKKYREAAFYNTTGGGMLRIHKMVINDFGMNLVRDGKYSILKTVTFRITNTTNGKYIIFKGFVDAETKPGHAVEYNADRSKTGKRYDVTYNQGAQWTVSGLNAGTYTVEEVGDGLTFEYVEESNSSRIIEQSKWSRVTKYDVTEDEETNITKYRTGGNNKRVVFSADLTTDGNTEAHHLDVCPTVTVGDPSVGNCSHTQTAQVCNYYSIPVGPIRVVKKFTGGAWKNMDFKFNIEPVSCVAKDSAGNVIQGVTPPSPERTTVVLSNPTSTDKAISSAMADFGSISFRYEGEYFYKITEEDTGIDGVKYDTNVYYVKVDVVKKYTTAKKTYSSGNMTELAKYKNNGVNTTIKEDFYYLGADITYTNKKGEIVAKYGLYLKPVEKTDENFPNEFDVEKIAGSINDVAFSNTRSGKLTVNKVWLDSEGNDESNKHSSLKLSIWQRAKGNADWVKYGEDIVLASNKDPNNNWRCTVTDIPLVNEDGIPYEYTVKEADSYTQNCEVTYKYVSPDGKATEIKANSLLNDNNRITVADVDTYDTGYAMTNKGIDFGEVTITNKSVTVNVLPSAGGKGTAPYTMAGAALIIFATAAMFAYRRKKKV